MKIFISLTVTKVYFEDFSEIRLKEGSFLELLFILPPGAALEVWKGPYPAWQMRDDFSNGPNRQMTDDFSKGPGRVGK